MVVVVGHGRSPCPVGSVTVSLIQHGVDANLRGRVISGVIFGVGDDYPGMPGDQMDVVYRLTANEWNGNTSVELKIADVRPAATAAVSGFEFRVSR